MENNMSYQGIVRENVVCRIGEPVTKAVMEDHMSIARGLLRGARRDIELALSVGCSPVIKREMYESAMQSIRLALRRVNMAKRRDVAGKLLVALSGLRRAIKKECAE